MGCTAEPIQINAVTKIAHAFQSAGLKLFVLVNQGVTDANDGL
jgi:hypothetical protein